MESAPEPYVVLRQSALMLKCSDLEPVLHDIRMQLDPSAADGVPAHLNLLYPFTTRLSVDQDDQLDQVLRDFGRFQLEFATTAWFGTDSVYLPPTDPVVLSNLVTRIRDVFPDHPAFGHDPWAWGTALTTLLADPGRRAELGRVGRQRALDMTWEVSAARTLEQYRRLL